MSKRPRLRVSPRRTLRDHLRRLLHQYQSSWNQKTAITNPKQILAKDRQKLVISRDTTATNSQKERFQLSQAIYGVAQEVSDSEYATIKVNTDFGDGWYTDQYMA